MSNMVRVRFSSEHIKMLRMVADGSCDVILKVPKKSIEQNCMSDVVRVKLSAMQVQMLNRLEDGCYNVVLKVAEDNVEGIYEVLESEYKTCEQSSQCPAFDLDARIAFAKAFMYSPSFRYDKWAWGRALKGDFSGRDPLGNYNSRIEEVERHAPHSEEEAQLRREQWRRRFLIEEEEESALG